MLQLQDQMIKCVTQPWISTESSSSPNQWFIPCTELKTSINNIEPCFQMNVQVFRCKQTWRSPAVRYPRSHPKIGSDKNTRMNLRTWSWTAASLLWEELKEAVCGSSRQSSENSNDDEAESSVFKPHSMFTARHTNAGLCSSQHPFSYILKQLLILDKVLKWWVHGLRAKRSSNLPVRC